MNEREQVFSAYESWLLRQPLAMNTQDAYRFHVRQYGEYLATRPATGDDPLRHPIRINLRKSSSNARRVSGVRSGRDDQKR
jgi:hypothetical protein